MDLGVARDPAAGLDMRLQLASQVKHLSLYHVGTLSMSDMLHADVGPGSEWSRVRARVPRTPGHIHIGARSTNLQHTSNALYALRNNQSLFRDTQLCPLARPMGEPPVGKSLMSANTT